MEKKGKPTPYPKFLNIPQSVQLFHLLPTHHGTTLQPQLTTSQFLRVTVLVHSYRRHLQGTTLLIKQLHSHLYCTVGLLPRPGAKHLSALGLSSSTAPDLTCFCLTPQKRNPASDPSIPSTLYCKRKHKPAAFFAVRSGTCGSSARFRPLQLTAAGASSLLCPALPPSPSLLPVTGRTRMK